MYSSNRTTIPSSPPVQRNIAIPFVHGIFDRRFTPCSDLRAVGVNSDVIVYDAATMKPLRRESPNGDIVERY